MGINKLDRIGLQERFERLLCLTRSALPVGTAQAIPDRRETNFIGVGVLNDQPFKPIWPTSHDAEAYRTAVVLNVEPGMGEADLLEK